MSDADFDVVEYSGWRCARFVSGDVEALVTLDVGPRVIHLGLIGKANQFHIKPKEAGLTGGDVYRGYGGHRLWLAPEIPEITYFPENAPVEVIDDETATWFASHPDQRGLQRQLSITGKGNGLFSVSHRVLNDGDGPATFALWALTVMAPGGTLYVPQCPDNPAMLVEWPYTDLTDSRYSIGPHFISLRQSDEGPTKFGAFVESGWAAYLNDGVVFKARFPAIHGAIYPDLGCNFEAYTRRDLLEVESLGPLLTLQPGESAVHEESWALMRLSELPENELSCAAALASI